MGSGQAEASGKWPAAEPTLHPPAAEVGRQGRGYLMAASTRDPANREALRTPMQRGEGEHDQTANDRHSGRPAGVSAGSRGRAIASGERHARAPLRCRVGNARRHREQTHRRDLRRQRRCVCHRNVPRNSRLVGYRAEVAPTRWRFRVRALRGKGVDRRSPPFSRQRPAFRGAANVCHFRQGTRCDENRAGPAQVLGRRAGSGLLPPAATDESRKAKARSSPVSDGPGGAVSSAVWNCPSTLRRKTRTRWCWLTGRT